MKTIFNIHALYFYFVIFNNKLTVYDIKVNKINVSIIPYPTYIILTKIVICIEELCNYFFCIYFLNLCLFFL
jgi:hypothetical protein